MSVEAIKEELARLSPEEQSSIMRYLAKLKNLRDPWLRDREKELGEESETFIPLSESKAMLMKKWASEAE